MSIHDDERDELVEAIEDLTLAVERLTDALQVRSPAPAVVPAPRRGTWPPPPDQAASQALLAVLTAPQ